MNFQGWLTIAGVQDYVSYVSDPNTLMSGIYFSNYRLIYVCSAYRAADNPYGITDATNNALIARSRDLVDYVNRLGGSLIVLTQAGLQYPYGFLPDPLVFVSETFSSVAVTQDMALFSPTSTADNLFHNYWHGYFDGPIDYGGVYRVLVYQQGYCSQTNGQYQNCAATMVANMHTKLTNVACWNKAADASAAANPLCWRCVSCCTLRSRAFLQVQTNSPFHYYLQVLKISIFMC